MKIIFFLLFFSIAIPVMPLAQEVETQEIDYTDYLVLRGDVIVVEGDLQDERGRVERNTPIRNNKVITRSYITSRFSVKKLHLSSINLKMINADLSKLENHSKDVEISIPIAWDTLIDAMIDDSWPKDSIAILEHDKILNRFVIPPFGRTLSKDELFKLIEKRKKSLSEKGKKSEGAPPKP